MSLIVLIYAGGSSSLVASGATTVHGNKSGGPHLNQQNRVIFHKNEKKCQLPSMIILTFQVFSDIFMLFLLTCHIFHSNQTKYIFRDNLTGQKKSHIQNAGCGPKLGHGLKSRCEKMNYEDMATLYTRK